MLQLLNIVKLTRTAQTATPFLVREQNKDLRGLGHIESIGSGGILGRAGTVDKTLAAEVGKYIALILSCEKKKKWSG